MKTFKEKDLISFGIYLLSEEREKNLRQTSIEVPGSLPYEVRFRGVYDADIKNWEAIQRLEKQLLKEFVLKHKPKYNIGDTAGDIIVLGFEPKYLRYVDGTGSCCYIYHFKNQKTGEVSGRMDWDLNEIEFGVQRTITP